MLKLLPATTRVVLVTNMTGLELSYALRITGPFTADKTSASVPPHPDAPGLRGGSVCRAEPRSFLLLRQQPL